MDSSSIRKKLRPYLILANRKTTVNHAFASALAPHDEFDANRVRVALRDLGQNPDELTCVYCGSPAETWDHVFAIVRDSAFSGNGHRLGNLLPCCKTCNSRKGNKHWLVHLDSLGLAEPVRKARKEAIERFLAKYAIQDQFDVTSADYIELEKRRREILRLFAEADKLAARIRSRRNSLA